MAHPVTAPARSRRATPAVRPSGALPARSRAIRAMSLTLVAAATLGACADRGAPTEPRATEALTPAAARPNAAVSHAPTGGNAHFFWLPPLVDAPTAFAGPFDGTQSPTVQICRLDGGSCAQVVATLTLGSRASDVRVDAAAEQYVAAYQTGGLDRTKQYRIAVAVGSLTLGTIDFRLGRRSAPAVGAGGVATVPQGSTLPIKFRIEEGALSRFRAISVLNATDKILHVNPADPVLLTVPAGNGEIAQFLGERDALGLPKRVTALVQYPLANPAARDVVTYDALGRPARTVLRDGTLLTLEYLDNGLIRIVVKGPGGGLSFAYIQPGDGLETVIAPEAAGAASGTTNATALAAAAGAATTGTVGPTSLAALATPPSHLIIGIREQEGTTLTPYSGATVLGVWEASDGRKGAFSATEGTAGSGIYGTDLPLAASALTPELQDLACKAINKLGCQALKAASKTVCSLLAIRVPGEFGIELLAGCTAGIDAISRGCQLQLTGQCEQLISAIDNYVNANTTITITANILGDDRTETVTKSFGPPVPGVADIDVILPSTGFSGLWRGTWTGQFGNSGPFSMTLMQTGSRVVGVYDLSYTSIVIGGTVAGDILTVDPSTFCCGTAFITLARTGNTLSGTEIDRYTNGQAFSFTLVASKQAGSVVVTSTSAFGTEMRLGADAALGTTATPVRPLEGPR